MRPNTNIWRSNRIESEKIQIKAELDRYLVGSNTDKRLVHALERIAELGDDPAPLAQLRCYIYIVSALVHHARYGGLNPKQIQKLAKTAKALLRVSGVEILGSELGGLYADLHSVLAQIYRRGGMPLKAAWEQRVCAHYFRKCGTSQKGFQAFSNGVFSLRLGHAAVALEEFSEAEKFGLPNQFFGRLRMETLKALRLSQNFLEADKMTKITLQNPSLSDRDRKEILWESLCREAQATLDISALVHAVRRGQQYNEAIYVQEAFLWTRSVESRKWMEQFKSFKQLGRNTQLGKQRTGYLRHCVRVIERCYDYSIPLLFRFNEVGEIVQTTDRLVSIDRALLVLLALLRWLTRSKAHRVARLVWDEYKSLSYRLTQGQSPDALGFAPHWLLKLEIHRKREKILQAA